VTAPDAHYADPRLARYYDVECLWGPDRDFYLRMSGTVPLRILDLGCGTGALSSAMADRGHQVTGVDPAQPMLDIARTRPGGTRVRWVPGTAAQPRVGGAFDLIVMTGHAFQTLAQPDEMAAALHQMSGFLAAGGRVMFETRNPDIDWSARWHDSCAVFALPKGRLRVTRQVVARGPGTLTFVSHYDDGTTRLTSRSTLAFPTLPQILAAARAAGLSALQIFGDWDGRPFDSGQSDELILTFGHA
jgi:SAM-dependent methyltransferase